MHLHCFKNIKKKVIPKIVKKKLHYTVPRTDLVHRSRLPDLPHLSVPDPSHQTAASLVESVIFPLMCAHTQNCHNSIENHISVGPSY